MNKIHLYVAALMITPALGLSVIDSACAGSLTDKYKMHEHATYKLHHNNKKWIDEAQKQVNQNYLDAVKKINASQLEESQKKLLLEQAEMNRELVLQQIDERTEHLKENMQKCMDAKMFDKDTKHEKQEREAVKAVHKILTDN